MTDEEVIERMLSRAGEAGWRLPPRRHTAREFDSAMHGIGLVETLFDHEFARACFRGTPRPHRGQLPVPEFPEDLSDWQWHLVQLALTEPHQRLNYVRQVLDALG